MSARAIDWDGLGNARDLGGIPTPSGSAIRHGAIVRSATPELLTADGWAALERYGVRTIVDLRNPDEIGADLADRPVSLTTLRLPLDGVEDRFFWDRWEPEPPPLYYGPFLERSPDRVATVISAIATADPGGVLVHCVGGRDRTGLISMLLLALAGVAPDRIAADHELGCAGVGRVYARLGISDAADLDRLLAERGTSATESIEALAGQVDVEAQLRRAGLSARELAALRARLLGFG